MTQWDLFEAPAGKRVTPEDLKAAFQKLYNLMVKGAWHTTSEISGHIGVPRTKLPQLFVALKRLPMVLHLDRWNGSKDKETRYRLILKPRQETNTKGIA